MTDKDCKAAFEEDWCKHKPVSPLTGDNELCWRFYRLAWHHLKAEHEDMHASFDLRWKADMRAIKRWQEATGKKDTWSDHADLCVWLMGELAAAQEREASLARLAEDALRDHSVDRHAAVVHALQVIQSALSQSSHEQATQSDVPTGYIQVPKEPTLDMYYAACKAYCAWEVQCAAEERAGREFSQPNFTHSDVYRAMIAAAPENATKQGI